MKIKNSFWYSFFSNAYKFEKDLDVVKDAIAKMINEDTKTTFKINTKRSDKHFLKSHKTLIEKLQDMFFIM